MRCTVDLDSRVWRAICRILQCVPSLGLVSSVLRTNCATRSSLIGRGRPGATHHAARTHLAPGIAAATCPPWRWSGPVGVRSAGWSCPKPLSKMTGPGSPAPPEGTRTAQSSELFALLQTQHQRAFGRPMAISTPHSAPEMPYSQQYYCHLFVGQYTSKFKKIGKFVKLFALIEQMLIIYVHDRKLLPIAR